MNTIFQISTKQNVNNIITLEFTKPIRFHDFVRYVKENMAVDVEEDEEKTRLIFKKPKNAFSILQSVVDMFIEVYLLATDTSSSQGTIYDENMNPIPRPRGDGTVHKVQYPSNKAFSDTIRSYEDMTGVDFSACDFLTIDKIHTKEKSIWQKIKDYITEKFSRNR